MVAFGSYELMITDIRCRPSRLLLYTGILTVGVGDAVVSFRLTWGMW